MRTRVPADSLVGKAILSTRLRPGATVGLGLTASLLVPVAVFAGGPAVILALPLVGVTALADSSYALLAVRSTRLSRRVLVFEPLAGRVGEAAWLAALWLLGAPGWVVVATGALSWIYVQTRSRARQVGLRDLGMVTLGERSVRVATVALGFGAAGVVAVFGGPEYGAWISGAVTVAAIAWMLMSMLGLLQLIIVVAAALRNE
ncbi:CDP-alcohol phosphatidyltransferase [Glycomyces xiaoerkulensis]|uniref:CDP-alcohol phosphatidyltransferase n=1 Tax=Glycomyces xiaoerkulensis TaxID=2038139 RepID=UPI000C25D90F|nr:CDP-alcohol phosphatidyltransferase [Glycomyces xiaoerkulensis]